VIIINLNKLSRAWCLLISFAVYAENLSKEASCIAKDLQPSLKLVRNDPHDDLQALLWQPGLGVCHGCFQPLPKVKTLSLNQIYLQSDALDLNPNGCSSATGHVSLQYNQQLLEADSAYIYRDPKTQKFQRVELHHHISVREPGKKIVAEYGLFYPYQGFGQIWNAAYRLDLHRAHAKLPAWGRASYVQRFPNGVVHLKNASLSTCSPAATTWGVVAQDLELNPKTERGVAKHSFLRVFNKPIFYLPYLSFPISSKRQSGFLTPTVGFTNISGYDYALPYYWNIAPNFDMTLVPHLYSMRGLMLGGEMRYLQPSSSGMFLGNILPNDQLFGKFLNNNDLLYPQLQHLSKNRWSGIWHHQSQFLNGLGLKIDYQKVSDDYYLQDFSSNLSVMTENQLLRQGELYYQSQHWVLGGMLQNYQTLQPINQSSITHLYARQPQFYAQGRYDRIFGLGVFDVLGQYDQFQWTGGTWVPQGPRMHINPSFSVPLRRSYGYLKPSAEFIGNFYQIANTSPAGAQQFNLNIPRLSVDSGLIFDRYTRFWQQTIEPRLYYLYVPYRNQTVVPAYESAYMIFNTDQLFRPNRFSGFDRIGDTNQLSYALSSRWLNPGSGEEKLNLTVGSISYFRPRQLNLCYSVDASGNCQDDPLYLGYLSPSSTQAPVASRLIYSLLNNWSLVGGYVYDPATNGTNNGDVSIHFQSDPTRVLHLGYSYLVNGNVISGLRAPLEQQALNQATAAYAWPLSEKWGSLAAYSYNISNGYAMMMLGGVQYDSCCWALRVLGGRTFQSLEPQTLQPQYNNNIYLQILLKGLGSASNSDPSSILQTYLPGLYNVFKH